MADVETIENVDSTTELEEQLVASSHKLAIDIYKILDEESPGNLLVSSLSIQLTLVLMALGARGETEEELLSSLQLSKDRSKWLDDVKSLMKVLTEHKSLKTATELFIGNTYKLKNDFVEIATTYLKCHFQFLDFISAPDFCRININDWIPKNTNIVGNLLRPGSITPETNLLVVNTIHFKHTWKYEFKIRSSKNRPFYLNKYDDVKVSMMYVEQIFLYAEKDTYQALELPFEGDEFSMLILLPIRINQLWYIEQQLPNIDLVKLKSEMSLRKVEVFLPKFALKQHLCLNSILPKTGFGNIFREKISDLSGLYEGDELPPMAVNNIIHESSIDVTEEGNEVPPLPVPTGGGFLARMRRFFTLPTIFLADHPFLFFILYRNRTVFIGRVAKF